MNSIHFVGRLTKDPELSHGKTTNMPYCNFTIAVDRGSDKEGNKLDADFPKLIAFGNQAENICKYLEKGSIVAVDGQFRTVKYQKEGQQQYDDKLVANRVQFLSFKKNAESI